MKLQSEELIYIIFGDLHLAKTQLPHKIGRLLKKKSELLCIHQDSENLYFKLAKQKLENRVSILRSGKNRFCIMTSPPWIDETTGGWILLW